MSVGIREYLSTQKELARTGIAIVGGGCSSSVRLDDVFQAAVAELERGGVGCISSGEKLTRISAKAGSEIKGRRESLHWIGRYRQIGRQPKGLPGTV